MLLAIAIRYDFPVTKNHIVKARPKVMLLWGSSNERVSSRSDKQKKSNDS